ncbi:UbiA prenyltransferase family-domain-containing protein [Jimgerdemannia flammicorona]|uniref:UbiA prenyltransferase family-domain-containing protein n=1 Tax=Jimgerdemannia flammicorona TaxID=994334 RepID=A0A433CWK2_9FUNG|nr:UbiA prenyltransferase family-domain-containing protein [Jimgerdemannia flammicorona]
MPKFSYHILHIFKPHLAAIRHELVITYRLSYRDWNTTIIPSLLMALGAFYQRFLGSAAQPQGFSLTDLQYIILPCLGRLFAWSSLYLYCFNWANQILGVEEDRANKPDRPIPAGLVSIEGAKLRFSMVAILLLIVGYIVAGWGPGVFGAVLWGILIALYELGGWSRNPFLKNLFVGLGGWLMTAVVYSILVADDVVDGEYRSPGDWMHLWGLTFCLFHSSLIHMQDLRDVDVDAAAGRITFPILLGDTLTRWLTVLVLFAISYMMAFVGKESLIGAGLTMPFEAVIIEWFSLAWAAGTALRLLAYRTLQNDHVTYTVGYGGYFCIQMVYAGMCISASTWSRI